MDINMRILTKYFTRLFLLFSVALPASGQVSETIEIDSTIETSGNITVIKEYTYNASEDDSKNSSRAKALKQLKILLTEEVGVHIESLLEVKESAIDNETRSSVTQEIKTLSSGITRLKIMEESWDGKRYFVKASVIINPNQTMKLLVEAIRSRASEKDIQRLNKILAEQNQKLAQESKARADLNRKLVLQEIINESKRKELIEVKKQLVAVKGAQSVYEKEIVKAQSEADRIKDIVHKAQLKVQKQNAKACMMDINMTRKDVIEAIGEPDAKRGDDFYYGTISITFGQTTGLSWRIWGC